MICGEIKLAITLRMLAGGSYLDLAALFTCGMSYVYEIFHHVNKHWICNNKFMTIDFYNNLTDVHAMREAAKSFASGKSMGLMYGCIGALDGWLVRIHCPSILQDGVKNCGGFFSRKEFLL